MPWEKKGVIGQDYQARRKGNNCVVEYRTAVQNAQHATLPSINIQGATTIGSLDKQEKTIHYIYSVLKNKATDT